MNQPDTQQNIFAAQQLAKALKKDFKGSGIVVQISNLDGSELVERFTIGDEDTKTILIALTKALRVRLSNLLEMHERTIKSIKELIE